MKIYTIVYTLVFIGISHNFAHANKDNPWDRPSTLEELYEQYSFTPPQIILHHLQRAALYFHKVGEDKALEVFNRNYGESEWNAHDGYRFAKIISCKNDVILTHPTLKKIINRKGFASSYKDGKGKQFWLIGCNRLKKHPKGSVTEISLFWSGIKGLSRQLVIMVPIPGTDYQVQTFYPTLEHQEEFVQTQLEGWSLPDYNKLYDIYNNKKYQEHNE